MKGVDTVGGIWAQCYEKVARKRTLNRFLALIYPANVLLTQEKLPRRTSLVKVFLFCRRPFKIK